ncbi:MAG: DUF1254 domain-containing protein [Hyphomicrobiaceae bacterium]
MTNITTPKPKPNEPKPIDPDTVGIMDVGDARATDVRSITSELPPSVRLKLRPDLELAPTPKAGFGALTDKVAAAAVRLRDQKHLSTIVGRLRGYGPIINQAGARSVTRIKALKAPAQQHWNKIGWKRLTAPGSFATRVLKKGKDASVGLGTTLDKIAREVPKQRQAKAPKPVHNDDVTTEALQRRVRERAARPSIFGINALLTAVVTGGLIHIGTTFAIPMLGHGSAFRHLRSLPLNAMIVMPQQIPGSQILPFLAPDMLYAFCRYDVRAAPLVVQARLPENGWSLALYTPQGDNFYAAPGQPQGAVEVSFVLAPATDRVINLLPNARRPDLKMNQVTAPQSEGLLVIRAPIKGLSYLEPLKAELKRATCTPQAR